MLTSFRSIARQLYRCCGRFPIVPRPQGHHLTSARSPGPDDKSSSRRGTRPHWLGRRPRASEVRGFARTKARSAAEEARSPVDSPLPFTGFAVGRDDGTRQWGRVARRAHPASAPHRNSLFRWEKPRGPGAWGCRERCRETNVGFPYTFPYSRNGPRLAWQMKPRNESAAAPAWSRPPGIGVLEPARRVGEGTRLGVSGRVTSRPALGPHPCDRASATCRAAPGPVTRQ